MNTTYYFKSSFGFRALLVAVAICVTNSLYSQNDNDIVEDSLFDVSKSKVHWDMAFSFKTQNYFRGLLPSGSPAFSTNAGVIWKSWILGMYGGVGLDGKYQETDFILIFKKPRFNLHLEYFYNFTQGISDIPDASGLFDFKRATTRGLLDFLVNIDFDKEGHWKLFSSTFLFGRDTDIKEVFEPGNSIPSLERTDQRYTQYLELSYAWYNKKYKVKAHVGGAFSWHDPSGPQYYGDRPGFNNIGINITRKFKIHKDVKIPVKASMYMNTIAQKSYLILSINLIQLSEI